MPEPLVYSASGRVQSEMGVRLFRFFTCVADCVTNTICLGRGDEGKLGACVIKRRDPAMAASGQCLDLDQRGATLMGLTTGMAFVLRNCPCNAHQALCHRHGTKAPPFSASFDPIFARLKELRPMLFSTYLSHLSHWSTAWLEKWPQKKREAIIDSELGDDVLPDRVKVMVKREVNHALPSKARLIQFYPNFATQAKFGPEFYAMQKTYTEVFHRFEILPGVRITFASGLNASSLGKWMEDVLSDIPNPMFYERDGKNWDSTMQRPHMDVRLAAYDVGGAEFVAFVSAGFEVTGTCQGSALKYKLTGTVKSGHNDTTLGNSLVNAFIAALSMAKCGLRGDIIVAGDDLLSVVDGDFDEHALAGVERDFGIVPEYRKFDNVLDVSFISGVWFRCNTGFIFAPKPGRLLARLFWTTKPPPPKRYAQYCNGIVAGLRPTCSAMPIIGAFLEAHYRDDVEVDAVAAWQHRTELEVDHALDLGDKCLRDSFCARYGLTHDDVAEVEQALRELPKGSVGFLSHPVLDRIVGHDLADVHVRPIVDEQ